MAQLSLYIENNLAAYTIIQRVYLSWFKYEVALPPVSIIKKTNDDHLQQPRFNSQ